MGVLGDINVLYRLPSGVQSEGKMGIIRGTQGRYDLLLANKGGLCLPTVPFGTYFRIEFSSGSILRMKLRCQLSETLNLLWLLQKKIGSFLGSSNFCVINGYRTSFEQGKLHIKLSTFGEIAKRNHVIELTYILLLLPSCELDQLRVRQHASHIQLMPSSYESRSMKSRVLRKGSFVFCRTQA